MLGTLVVTLAAVPGLFRLQLRTDGHALVAGNAPEVLYDRTIRNRFGIEDNIVVLIRSSHPEGIFNRATIERVRDLSTALAGMPGINRSNVLSLATEPSFRLRPGTLIHENLLDRPLNTKPELDQLREDIRRIELYTGTFVGRDGKSTVILVGVPPDGERGKIYRQILELVSSKDSGEDEVMVTGAPVAEALLGVHILQDLGVPRGFLGADTRLHEKAAEGGWARSTRNFINQHIGLVPISIAVMMLIFFLSFRNGLAMLVPLPGVAVTLIFVFGLMGWCGVPVYLTIAVMPVLLTAICVTNDIYLFSRYLTIVRPGKEPVEAVRETFEQMVSPVTNTSLTSAVGFLSFAFSPLAPVRAFGLVCAFGVLFGLFYSLTVIPAILVLIDPRRFRTHWGEQRRSGAESEPRGLVAWFERFGAAVSRYRTWIIPLALVIVVAAPFGLKKLAVQDSWTNAFEPSSEFHRATRLVNSQFFGMHLLFISFDEPKVLAGEISASDITPEGILLPGELIYNPMELAGGAIVLAGAAPGAAKASACETNRFGAVIEENSPILFRSHSEMAFKQGNQLVLRLAAVSNQPPPTTLFAKAGRVKFESVIRSQVRPGTIRELAALADFVRQRTQDAVGGVLGPADYLSTTRFMARPDDPKGRILAEDAGENKLMWDFYGLARGPQRLRQIVDTNYWESLTTVFLKDANFADTARLMSDIRTYQKEKLAPKGIKLGFAGDVALSQSLIGGIVATQLQSLFWSLLGIFLVTTWFGGSLRGGVLCVLPSLVAVLIKFAVMGWSGIPLGVATSMFAAMTLGIGVSCAIHLLEGFDRARAMGLGVEQALSRSLRLTGPPALLNTVSICLGFGVLMLSQVPANARLGMLLVLGLVNCFIASILLLPLLLARWPGRPTVPDQNPQASKDLLLAQAPGRVSLFPSDRRGPG
ncbi:MAG TPA: MMPL family transporter [Candidatus Dormibacteraeota bacterium]|nr:MMPL family transporter [Candidatus Dormibacteraeota bacterium]